MRHPRIKILLTSLLAVLFVLAFAWIMTLQNRALMLRDNSSKETLKLEAVSRTLEDLDSSWKNVEDKFTKRYEVDAILAALALRNVIEDEGDGAIARYASGAVIKAAGGEVTAPEDIGDRLGLEASLFEKDQDLFAAPGDPTSLVVYSRIGTSQYYYVQWYEDTVLSDRVEEAVNFPAILQNTETNYDVYAMLVAGDESGGGRLRTLYASDLFDGYDGIEEMGLTVEDLAREADGEARMLTLAGISFQYVVGAVKSLNGYVILMVRQPNLYVKALEKSGFCIALMILLLTALLVTGFSLYGYIRNNLMTLEREERYAPSHVKRIAILYGIIGTIGIALCCILVYALNGLYDESAKGKDRLRILEEDMVSYADRYVTNVSEFREIYLEYGMHIAELLDNYPALQTPDVLDDLSDSISASSITLYDSEGNETVSSGEYVDLALGRDPDSATYEFRQLLKGTKAVVREAETDEVTGLNEVRLGIRMKDASGKGSYGAMLICLDPQQLSFAGLNGIDTMLQSLTGPGDDIWLCDPATGIITASADASMEGRNVAELGLDETSLKGGVIKNVDSEEGSWLVTSTQLKNPEILKWTDAYADHIAFYAISDPSTTRGMVRSAVVACIAFVAIYVILALLVLNEYTGTFFDEWKMLEKRPEVSGGGRSRLKAYLAAVSPEKRGVIAMECIAWVYLSQQIPIASFDTHLSRTSVYYYIVAQKWDKGLNLFALAGILLLLGEILVSVILLRLLFNVFAQFLGAKGKTICRLINSFLLYASLIMFLVKTFEFIGFSRAAILGAIGTLGLAVSLGAQNFISDVIAGLTYIFEGTFHVGDELDILTSSGIRYHGKVVEVGLRFVRIKDEEGNVITFSNQEARAVKNRQVHPTCTCEIVIPSDQPVDEIEAVLERELPKAAEKDRRILSGPKYMGIVSMCSGTVTLSVMTQCTEADSSYVKRLVNHTVYSILTENGYRI